MRIISINSARAFSQIRARTRSAEGSAAFCQQYTACKPSPASDEFIDLANILMNENGWFMPETCQDALELYLNLISIID